MFTALKRLFIYLGFIAQSATETQAIDEAVIQSNIKNSRAKAAQSNEANGQLQTTLILLRQQIREEDIRAASLTAELQLAADRNDEAEGADLAERLDLLNGEMATNKEQLATLEGVYNQNLDIIANSLREVQKLHREFIATRAQVKSSESLKGLANNIQNSITELQGMTEGGQAMQRMKERAASGQGQLKATTDLAARMGASVLQTQNARQARGKALFNQFKAKGTLTNTEAAASVATPESKPAERQKISEN